MNKTHEEYYRFLGTKIATAKDFGFVIERSEISECLKPHQKDAVMFNILGGRRANFLQFGLGKTLIQIETLRILLKAKSGKALIICPLGVKQEFFQDAGNLLGIELKYVKNQGEVEKADNGSILITNYERVRDGDIEPLYFTAITLDEASVLRGYGTKTYQTFLDKFKGVQYKFVATATPSPNKFKELIHYAGFLEVMDTGQALTRFFKRDSTKANKLTLYPHKEKEFWYWLSSWGLFLEKPSDLGYKDSGYDLPDLKIIEHEINIDHSLAGTELDGQVKMFRDSAISLQDASKEKQMSIPDRVGKMMEILKKDPDSNYILWHDLENERKEIKKSLKEYKGTNLSLSEIYGSKDIDIREKELLDFAYGRTQYISTKPTISGSGCNFQRYCHKMIFVGITYKFNDFLQAIHRAYRYLQTNEVEVHLIYTEAEREIVKTLYDKWSNHKKLVSNMISLVKNNGINTDISISKLMRTIGIERKTVKTANFEVSNNDAVLEYHTKPDNSIGLVVTSIPFSNHYEYTPSYNDFGHTQNNDEFWAQMDFLTPEIYRTLQPGRLACIHVKDRVLFSSMTEFSMPTVSGFHCEAYFHYKKHGFAFMGMITIETDVVRENNQTYRLGWSEKCKDGTKMGVGSPEYLMLFRKQPTSYDNAYADIPVMKNKSLYTRGMWQIDARAKWNSSGNRFLSPDELKHYELDVINRRFTDYFESEIYSYEKHVKTANDLDEIGKLPATFEALRLKSRNWFLWDDVNRMLTLNSQQSKKKQNMHICPLQFDIVDRCIEGFSNPGDLVHDPFGGLYTVPYRAIKLGRKASASELNADYHRDGLTYLRAAESEINMPTLFDFMN